MYAAQTQADVSVMPQIALSGSCGYTVNDDRVVVTVNEITNRRHVGDVSGTLSVELWALKQPYAGGSFNGVALAGTSIGEVSGQHYLADCRYDLIFAEPPTGTWFLSLMLREWTEMGYVTRDYVNFALPYVVAAKPRVVRSTADNVINVSFAGKSGGSPLPPEEGVGAPPKVGVAEPARIDPEKSSSRAVASLNEATIEEIAAVKGVSKKVAGNLVAARPFKSFDELLQVKGIGKAMIKKLRQLFAL
jgi:hypothetical protein